MSTKENTMGIACIGAGSYLGYKGLEHGLPRALGIRTEYHITSKENAELIKKSNYILDPKFGGQNGWSIKSKCKIYPEHSKGYVHITGFHPDNIIFKKTQEKLHKKLPTVIANFLDKPLKTFYRVKQCIMYTVLGKLPVFSDTSKMTKKEKIQTLFKQKTKKFYIPGIDSYFTKEFIPDCDDVALKSSKPLKVYSNRLSAMIAGFKKFGLKGIKENKSRVFAGLSILTLSTVGAYKLIKKGINMFKHNNAKFTNKSIVK